MHELLDKDQKIMVLVENENRFMITKYAYVKALIETTKQEFNVILKVYPHPECTPEELTEILGLFTKFYYRNNPNIEGALLKCDENPLLDEIGFKPISEESEFLYQKNNFIKEGRGKK